MVDGTAGCWQVFEARVLELGLEKFLEEHDFLAAWACSAGA